MLSTYVPPTFCIALHAVPPDLLPGLGDERNGQAVALAPPHPADPVYVVLRFVRQGEVDHEGEALHVQSPQSLPSPVQSYTVPVNFSLET